MVGSLHPVISFGPMEDFPEGLASVDLAAGSVRLELDAELYPLEALYGAAYIFIDRCYVLLDKPSDGKFRATLAPKTAGADLRALAGEFANELLSCAWRHQITRENRAFVEQVTVAAIGGAMGPPSLDDLAKFDFSSEALEDPLGIAQSWEEKYKKKSELARDGGVEPSQGSTGKTDGK
jgi:His-Xaa-Ser system protein HxsD